jgi:hypothetical protein
MQYLDLPGLWSTGTNIAGAQQQYRLRDLQTQMEQLKFQRASQQYQQMQGLMKGMAPEEQLGLLLAPDKWAESRFATHALGPDQSLVTSAGKPVYQSPGKIGLEDAGGNLTTPGTTTPGAASPGTNLLNAAPTATTPPVAGLGPRADTFDVAGKGIRLFETGGAPNPATATNPNSSATGADQWTEGTWLDVMGRHGAGVIATAVGPNANLQDPRMRQAVLDLRNDPVLSGQMAKLHAQDNAAALTQAGLQASPRNLLFAHFLGTEGASRFLSADPSAPAISAASPGAAASNRRIFYDANGRPRTVGEVMALADQIIAKAGGPAPQAGAGAPSQGTIAPAAPATTTPGPQAPAPGQPGTAGPGNVRYFVDRTTGKFVPAEGMSGYVLAQGPDGRRMAVPAPTGGTPYFGSSEQGLGLSELVRQGQLSPAQAATSASARVVQGPEGQVDLVTPQNAAGQGQPTNLRPRQLSAQERQDVVSADQEVVAAQNAKAALEQALSLNAKAYDGPLAAVRANIAALLPGEHPAAVATTQLDRLMSEQVLQNMKSAFGANPTEGERRFLIDSQAAASLTKEQRQALLQRGVQLAEDRIQRSRARGEALRGQSYFSPGGGAGATAAPTQAGTPAPDPLGIR